MARTSAFLGKRSTAFLIRASDPFGFSVYAQHSDRIWPFGYVTQEMTVRLMHACDEQRFHSLGYPLHYCFA